jgi:hypothetical protein
MKHLPRDYLIAVFVLTLTVALLFGCATKGKTTQPEGTAEQIKRTSEPVAKAPEATPSPPLTAKATAPTQPLPSAPPSKPPEVSQPSGQRTTEIVLAFVNLRQEPSMEGKIIRVLKKGTRLSILEEKAGWLHVRLEDGTEGWVGKAMTSVGTPPKSR